MKTLPLLALLSLSIACVPATKVDDVSSGASNKNAPYLWHDNAFPKNVQISSSFDSDEITAITAMSTAWYASLENRVQFFSHNGGTITEKSNSINSMDDMYDGIFGIYKTTNWPESLPSSALAVTQIYGRRYNVGDADEFVNIEHADILVNYDDFDFFPDTIVSGDYDLRSVVLHEMGHFLGLQHKAYNVASIMVPTLGAANINNRAPKSIDKVDIADKYHISITSSAAAIATTAPVYMKKTPGDQIRILIELHADGECVHKENGVVIQRHSAQLKK